MKNFDISDASGHAEMVDTILAIASMHYLFLKLEDALHIMSVAEVISPRNARILEFKAVLLTELQEYRRVLSTIEEVRSLGEMLPPDIIGLENRAKIALGEI